MPLTLLDMAALTSPSNILSYITFLFSEWRITDYSHEYMLQLSGRKVGSVTSTFSENSNGEE